MRALNSKEPRELRGTEQANLPFWSPDGRFIGFFSQGKLKRVDLEGGSPQTICEALNTDNLAPRGGAWSSDGVILFAPSGRDSLIYPRSVWWWHTESDHGIESVPQGKHARLSKLPA